MNTKSNQRIPKALEKVAEIVARDVAAKDTLSSVLKRGLGLLLTIGFGEDAGTRHGEMTKVYHFVYLEWRGGAGLKPYYVRINTTLPLSRKNSHC